MLAKNRNYHYAALMMNGVSQIGRPGANEERRIGARAGAWNVAQRFERGERGKRYFWARGSAPMPRGLTL